MSLDGKRILVTRSGEQAGELADRIRRRGGIPVMFPTIRLVPPADPGPLDEALSRISSFDWLVFASANAARFFCGRAAAKGIKGPPEGVRVASVGPGTSRELVRLGFPPAVTAGRHTAEGLVEAMAAEGIAGRKYLLPRAAEGREILQAELERRGGAVETVAVYENGLPGVDERTAAEIVSSPPDVCAFASPSAFRNFFILLGEEFASGVLSRSRIAVIGEVTAREVASRKFAVDIMPEKYTLDGLVEAMAASFHPARRDGG